MPYTYGHAVIYNQTVGASVRLLGWEHRAFLVRRKEREPLPAGWDEGLPDIQFVTPPDWFPGARRFTLPNPIHVARAAQSIARYLRGLSAAEQRRLIVFLEFFKVWHLIALTLALWIIPRADMAVILLYRMDIHKQASRGIYRFLNEVIRRLMGTGRFMLLTDSALLAKSLTALFRRPVWTMPIPHAETAATADSTPAQVTDAAGCAGKAVCWWPGRPAAEKGVDTMRRIAQMGGESAAQLCVAIAASAGIRETPGGCRIVRLDNHLERDTYSAWLHATDLILLPYSPEAYAERTSGIFVEAITAGKPALVTDGTWMAYELTRCGLGGLVIDWESPNVLSEILRVARDAQIKERLARMQAEYQRYHSQIQYAKTLRELCEMTGMTAPVEPERVRQVPD